MTLPSFPRVVVTGANGFVGRRVVASLVTAGYPVIAASRVPLDLPHGAEWRKSPALGLDADWGDVLANADMVVHAAARVHMMREQASDPLQQFRSVNVEGTAALARQAASLGVRRFLFVSSIKVNGEATKKDAPFTEIDMPRPVDAYGVSKWEAEQALAEIGRSTGMETGALRPVLVYGAGVGGNMATLAKLVRSGLPLPLAAVRNTRSIIHVDNLADAITRAVAVSSAMPSVMLMRDDASLSTPQLLCRLYEASGRRPFMLAVPPVVLQIAARMIGRGDWADRLLNSLEVDDSATRTALGWAPAVTLECGLRGMMKQ